MAGVGGRKPETPGLPSLTLSPAPATPPDIDRQTDYYKGLAKLGFASGGSGASRTCVPEQSLGTRDGNERREQRLKLTNIDSYSNER